MDLRELIASKEQQLKRRAATSSRTVVSTLIIGGLLFVTGYCWPKADVGSIETASKLILAGVGIMVAGLITTGILAVGTARLTREIYTLTVKQAVADLQKPDLRNRK